VTKLEQMYADALDDYASVILTAKQPKNEYESITDSIEPGEVYRPVSPSLDNHHLERVDMAKTSLHTDFVRSDDASFSLIQSLKSEFQRRESIALKNAEEIELENMKALIGELNNRPLDAD
jgi:hypothetical protein